LLRLSFGNAGELMQEPSRFLRELPPDLLDEWQMRSFSAY
jgi:hypothetical protein